MSSCLNRTERSHVEVQQLYFDHSERFDTCPQVLCQESQCYWKVEWSSWDHVAVKYIGISRKVRSDCWYGYIEKPWSLFCSANGFTVWHNDVSITYLTIYHNLIEKESIWPAITESFYSVSGTHSHFYTYTPHSVNTEHHKFFFFSYIKLLFWFHGVQCVCA